MPASDLIGLLNNGEITLDEYDEWLTALGIMQPIGGKDERHRPKGPMNGKVKRLRVPTPKLTGHPLDE